MKRQFPKFIAFFIAVMVSTMLQAAPFIGTYVVGSGETYTSLNSIINAMNTEGTSGHVTIKIKDGTYTQNINISGISTLSETSTLTIESNSGSASNVILRSANSYTLYTYNVSHISFKNLTFVQPYLYQRCLYINYSNNIEFDNCVITGTTYNSSSTSYSAIYLANRCDDFTLKNCNVTEGSYGLYSTSSAKNMMIDNCTFKDHYYGLRIYYANDLTFSNNTVSNISSQGTYFYNITDIDVNNNNISSSSYNYIQNCRASSNGQAIFTNNIFHSTNSYGIRLSSTNSDLEFYHNTFLSNSSYGFYVSSTTIDMVFKNNLVATNNCTYAMRVNEGDLQNADIDYNAYSNSSPSCDPMYNG
ncbi:MAG: right-handed parallel beta-helix repeat-containing protein, partial [Bacteroidia bacterium]|nr:right-handed parallel beta-helix repeat-containing protein [Bacteroidia bacterium]